MKPTTPLTLLSILPLAASLSIDSLPTTPSILEASIQRKDTSTTHPVQRDRLRKRASTLSETLSNDITLYFANVSLGTPAQPLALHLDTGSSDLWANTPTSAFCREYATICNAAGTYSANASSSYTYLNSRFNITYVDGTGAAGDYVTDTLTIGGTSLPTFQFGIGYTSTSQEGILGIGYPANEVAANYAGGSTYANLPKALMNRGVTSTMAYSLWLNDLDASTGSILFGGVNTAKFHGTLQTLPIVPEYGVYSEFIIALTALGLNGNAGSIASGTALPVLLDSGSSLTYLPSAYVDTIFSTWGATYDATEGAAFVPCSLARQSGSVDFTFSSSSATISVELNELVLTAGYTNNQPVCIFGIAPLEEGATAVLGDTFLRSAYVVYDLSSNQISIAQTNFNSTANNVVAISSGANGVPSATAVQNAVTSVATKLVTAAATADGASAAVTATYLAGAGRAARPLITPGPAAAVAAVLGVGAMMAL